MVDAGMHSHAGAWEREQLGKHVEAINTWNPKVSGLKELFLYIDLSSVDKDKKTVNLTQVKQILPIEAPSRARQLVKASDVLVSTVRPNLNGVACVPDGLNGATASTGYCVLRANNKTLHSQYLFYWVRSNLFVDDMMSKATGANYPAVSDKSVKQSKISLPPLAEQKKIAAILDAADRLRQKDAQLIAKYNKLSQSLFLDMFGDPVTNPMGWKKKKIGEVCTDIIDCVNKTAPVVDYETKYKMIRTTNIRDHKVDLSTVRYVEKDVYDKWVRRLIPKKGDVIFTREAPVGEAGVLESNDPVFLGQRTMEYRVDERQTNPYYLLQELMGSNVQCQIVKLSSGSTVKHLSVPDCKKFEINVPPITLQNQFAERIQHIEAQKQQAQAARQKSDDLFHSLLQRAFKGELTEQSKTEGL